MKGAMAVAKKGKQNRVNLKAVVIGVGAALLIGAGSLMLISQLVVNERVGEAQAAGGVFVIMFLASFVGNWIARRLDHDPSVYEMIVISMMYWLIHLVFGLLVFDGTIQNLLLVTGTVALGWISAYVLGRKKVAKGFKRKHRHR